MEQVRYRYVGFDLTNSPETEAIIQAVEQDNENVKITRFPGYVKVESLNRLVINKASVEEFLGDVWNTEDLQLAVTSYYGFMADWDDDHIVLQWDNV
jgi:phenol hydroxylase P2 protein